jgi:phage terminase large subunit GpA-like protein
MIAFAEKHRADFERFAALVQPAFAPRPILKSWEWVCVNGRTPDAQPFDGTLMPWARGVCDAWDHPDVREIVMMWGTRLGKTMVSMQLVAKAMATAPLNGIFATANEKLAIRTTSEKLYKVLAAIKETRRQLQPEHLRKNNVIRMTDCVWPVVWSGSNTMLADWGAQYGWANEVSKWDEKKNADGVGKAGDTLSQFLERFKEYQSSRKILLECSPGLKGKCKIERKYLDSNQCKYHVPCPHCKAFQVLKMGSGDGTGGIVFDKTPDGKLDAELAKRTATYQCERCRRTIADVERRMMMRRGQWVPKGCRVDKKGKLCGKPDRTCEIWGGQLSSLYSLQLRWGDIAGKFVESIKSPALLQVFKNDWLAETWEPFYIKTEPDEVAERLASEDDVPGVIPKWCTWLFAAVDVQAEYFKWILVACGPGERLAVVDRGACDTWAEVFEQCVNRATPHADGAALMPCLTLIDSGDGKKTDEVYKQCRAWTRPDRLVIPCKGSNTDMKGEPYQKATIGDGTKRGSKIQRRQALKFSGVLLIRINAFYYEPMINRWLAERQPGTDDSLSIPAELCDDDEFVRELCNGVQSDNPSKMDPGRLLWVPRWPSEPNDYRDGLKYCRCAMDVKFRGNWRTAERRQVTNTAAPVPRVREPEPQQLDGRAGRRRLTRERIRSRRERVARR